MSPTAVLVGAPGAGKSTVGRAFAGLTGVPFVDTDALVEARSGRRVAEIFTSDGEAAFRALEEEAVADALTRDAVVSLGGGAVLSARTREALRGYPVVLLSVGMAEGVRRTGLSSSRPLLAGINPRATFKALLDARLPLYEEVAVHVVATEGRSVDEVVTALQAALA